MLAHILVIMGFQLAGEILVASLALTFPGALCGLLMLLCWLSWRGGASEGLSRAATPLVDNLGLLFVPAGTAIVGFGTLLLSDGLAIGVALLLSTGLAILVSGLLAKAHCVQTPQLWE